MSYGNDPIYLGHIGDEAIHLTMMDGIEPTGHYLGFDFTTLTDVGRHSIQTLATGTPEMIPFERILDVAREYGADIAAKNPVGRITPDARYSFSSEEGIARIGTKAQIKGIKRHEHFWKFYRFKDRKMLNVVESYDRDFWTLDSKVKKFD